MKSVIIITDGAADAALDELHAKTPLEVANKPNIDELASRGSIGMVKTVPVGMAPGSDIANLAVMGYDPEEYYTGRSSLEAVSMGVELKEEDITFRCNLVTLSGETVYEDNLMVDYSAGEITTGEAKEIISDLAGQLEEDGISFYPGVSYRHVIVWKRGPFKAELTPPHDILDKKIKGFLPRGEGNEKILAMMKESYRILRSHPVNIKRKKAKVATADSIWLWGQGKKPALDDFSKRFGLDGSVISAVDLVKGIGICAGLEPVEVEGATGNIKTNFKGKADAALDTLINKDKDFVFIHIEAPDECGHQGKLEEKIKSIELIDEKVVKTIKEGLESAGIDFKMMILPDHPTPVKVRTHTSDPVPYLIYDSTKLNKDKEPVVFSEASASRSGNFFDTGYGLTAYFLD